MDTQIQYQCQKFFKKNKFTLDQLKDLGLSLENKFGISEEEIAQLFDKYLDKYDVVVEQKRGSNQSLIMFKKVSNYSFELVPNRQYTYDELKGELGIMPSLLKHMISKLGMRKNEEPILFTSHEVQDLSKYIHVWKEEAKKEEIDSKIRIKERNQKKSSQNRLRKKRKIPKEAHTKLRVYPYVRIIYTPM